MTNINKIALLHFKKTAGTSFYRSIKSLLRQEVCAEWNVEYDIAKNFAFICGHYDIEDIRDDGYSMICTLRYPPERVISLFNYTKSLSQKELITNNDIEGLAISNMAFEDYIRSMDDIITKNTRNYYCKSIFGPSYLHGEIFSEQGKLTEKAEELLKVFEFIGMFDDIPGSLTRVALRFGLPQPTKLFHEKSTALLTTEEKISNIEAVDADLMNTIIENNQDDIKLYRHFRKLFSYRRVPENKSVCWDMIDLPALHKGSEITISESDLYYRNMLYRHWHYVEDGVWSNGAESELILRLNKGVSTICLQISFPAWAGRVAATMDIYLDERHRHKYGISFKDTISKNDFDEFDSIIFASAFVPTKIAINVGDVCASNSAQVIIRLVTNCVYIPSRHGHGDDDRELGYKLHGISVDDSPNIA